MTEGAVYRPASGADWPAIAGVVNAARRADGADEVRTPESLASEHASLVMARDVVIAELDGIPVGYGAGQVLERSGALVAELTGAVHPAHRRRGIGTTLLRRTRDGAVAQMGADHRPLPASSAATRWTSRPASSRCSPPRASRPSALATRCGER